MLSRTQGKWAMEREAEEHPDQWASNLNMHQNHLVGSFVQPPASACRISDSGGGGRSAPWFRLAVCGGAKGEGRSHVRRGRERWAGFGPSAAEAQLLPERNDPGNGLPRGSVRSKLSGPRSTVPRGVTAAARAGEVGLASHRNQPLHTTRSIWRSRRVCCWLSHAGLGLGSLPCDGLAFQVALLS